MKDEKRIYQKEGTALLLNKEREKIIHDIETKVIHTFIAPHLHKKKVSYDQKLHTILKMSQNHRLE